jgi:type II secretory pathway pseudopilin PulG
MVGAGSTSSKSSLRFGAKRRSASTLIELLVVIAIIALLISILLPSLKRSMDLASATMCQYHLREIGHGIMMYRYDNKGWLPVSESKLPQGTQSVTAGVDVAGIGTIEEEIHENESWFVKLFPTYLQDPGILACPDDPYGFRITRARNRLREPAVADFASYGLNDFILTVNGGILANLDRHRPDRLSETILLCDLGPDEMRFSAQQRSRTGSGYGPLRNRGMTAWDDSFDPYSGRPANPWVTSRHSHGINIVTVGGSVRHVRTDDLIREPILREYPKCAAGDCPLCKELKWFHYTFAKFRLFWWTGSIPKDK